MNDQEQMGQHQEHQESNSGTDAGSPSTEWMNESIQHEYDPKYRQILDDLEGEHEIMISEQRLEHFFQALEDLFIVSTAHQAVSLQSGVGTLPIEFAKEFPSLVWTPTEVSTQRLQGLRDALSFFIQSENHGPVLGKDTHGHALYRDDVVKLQNLSREGYNGRTGKCLSVDPRDPERIGVKLETKHDTISLKGSNLVRVEKGVDYDQAVQIEMDRCSLQELLNRACVLAEDTSVPDHLEGKCALVTSSTWNSLSKTSREDQKKEGGSCQHSNIRSRDDELDWRRVLVLASQLLAPGGYLLQYDTPGNNGFADDLAMKEYVDTMKLELDIKSEKTPDSQSKLLLWCKRGGQQQ